MRNLLILNTEESIKINPNFDAVLDLNNKGKNFIAFEDLLDKNTNSRIYKQVRNFSKTWYKPFEKELTYDGISLPSLIEMNLLNFWPVFLKFDVLSKFLIKKSPKKIHLITNNEEDIRIINEIIKNKKIEFSFKLLKRKEKKKIEFKKSFYSLIARFQNLLANIYLKRKHKKKNILFLGNVRQTLPLLKKLKENKENVILRTGENLGKGTFVGYCDYYLTFKTERPSKRIKIIMHKKFDNFINEKGFNENVYFNILKNNFKHIFLEDFPKLISYINKLRKIHKKIDVIVTHNDILPFEKSLILTANKLSIPTLTMIEGFLPSKQISKDNLFIPFNADNIALFSQSQKDIIIKKYKIHKDKLNVVGYPLFDQYYSKPALKKEEIYSRYNIPLDKKIVIFTAERYDKNKFKGSIWGAFTQKQCEVVYEELFNAFKSFPELFLIVKKHPSGSLDNEIINKIAKKLNFNNYVISKDMDIHNLLNASYAIITRLSNMGLEAMLLGKYVIILDTHFDSNDNFNYTDFNASLHAKKPGELNKLLNKLLTDKNLQKKLKNNIKKFVKYHYSVNDGNSSERMAKLIEDTSRKNL